MFGAEHAVMRLNGLVMVPAYKRSFFQRSPEPGMKAGSTSVAKLQGYVYMVHLAQPRLTTWESRAQLARHVLCAVAVFVFAYNFLVSGAMHYWQTDGRKLSSRRSTVTT